MIACDKKRYRGQLCDMSTSVETQSVHGPLEARSLHIRCSGSRRRNGAAKAWEMRRGFGPRTGFRHRRHAPSAARADTFLGRALVCS